MFNAGCVCLVSSSASPLSPCIGEVASARSPALTLPWLKSVCGEHLQETGKRRTVQFGYAVPNCPLSVHPAWLGLSFSGSLCSQEVTLCVRSTSPPSAPSSLGKEEYASTASLMVPVLGVPGGYYTFLHTVKVPFGDTPP